VDLLTKGLALEEHEKFTKEIVSCSEDIEGAA